MTYDFLDNKETIKSGTLFTLGGDIWGYDIELFNYFGEKEILLEPERKFIVENALPPLNEIINVTCTILKSPMVLNNDLEPEKVLKNEIEDENKKNLDIENLEGPYHFPKEDKKKCIGPCFIF